MTEYGLSISEASNLSSLMCCIICLASPIFGYLVEKTGRNLLYATTAILLSTLGHCLFAFTLLNPIIPMVLYNHFLLNFI